jgi:glycosyltransferase involved in cell wall biosynthesis
MLKVAYYSSDNPTLAVARLRFIDPVKLLGREVLAGHGVAKITFAHGEVSRITNELDTELFRTADVIVVQRGFPRPETAEFLELLISSGKPLVYETDDDLRIVPNESQRGFLECIPYIEGVVRAAKLVTVATPYLAERFRPLNSRTLVLPNYLPNWLWARHVPSDAASDDRLTIGFCGSDTHQLDLEHVEEALIEVSRRHPVRLMFLGCMTDRLWDVPGVSFFEYVGDYARWPQRLARAAMDIAIVPLIDSEFNRCKSHIKFLELGYMGIPGVYSDVPAYRDTVQDGVTGLLAPADTAAWIDALERLIADAALRRRIRENARREVTERHLMEQHKGRWLDAYRSVL